MKRRISGPGSRDVLVGSSCFKLSWFDAIIRVPYVMQGNLAVWAIAYMQESSQHMVWPNMNMTGGEPHTFQKTLLILCRIQGSFKVNGEGGLTSSFVSSKIKNELRECIAEQVIEVKASTKEWVGKRAECDI